MNKRIIYLPVILAVLSLNAPAQNNFTSHQQTTGFQKVIAVNSSVLPAKITETRRQGYVVSGTQTNGFFGNSDAFLMTLNRQGKPQWTNGYDAEADYIAYESAELSDGSIAAATDQFDGRAGLLRVNKNGGLKFQKQYFIQDGAVNFTLLRPLSDGQFIAAGPVTDAAFNSGSILVKYNKNGGIIWKRAYDIPGVRSSPVALEVKGSTMFLASIIPTTGFSSSDTIALLKINSFTGAVVQSRKIWLSDHAIFNVQLVKRTDDRLVLSATLANNNTGETVNCLSLLNNSLELLKTSRLTSLPDGSFSGAVPTSDKGVALIYNDISFANGYLLKFNKEMQPVFARFYPKEYSGSAAYQLNTISNTDDDGFIMAGTRAVTDSTLLYVIKTDRFGKTGNCESETVSALTETFSLNTQAFTWPNVYTPELLTAEQAIPATPITAVETDLCPRVYQCYAAPETATAGSNEAEELTSFTVQATPNPSTNAFTIRVNTQEPVQVRVRDMHGRVVQQFTLQPNQPLQTGNSWKAGVYIAELVVGKERRILRLVKL